MRTSLLCFVLVLTGPPGAPALSPAGYLARAQAVGLVALSEVFGDGACDRFTPEEVPVHATPEGPLVGTLEVVRYWTLHEGGGCEGLAVRVRDDVPGEQSLLPTREYAYEAPGAIVLDEQDGWFEILLESGSGWVHPVDRDCLFTLEALLTGSLAYLTEMWDGTVADDPGSAPRPLADRGPGVPSGQISVDVNALEHAGDELWVEVTFLSHSPCVGNEAPEQVARAWVRAHSDLGIPAVRFHSRGC